MSAPEKYKKKFGTARANAIYKRGLGAYYSSGSRPNQTPESWGKARVASVLVGGKSRNIDKAIVKKYNIPLL